MDEAAKDTPSHKVPGPPPDEASEAVAELGLGRAIAWDDVHALLFDVQVLIDPPLDVGSVLHQFVRYLSFDRGDGATLGLELWDAPDRTSASDYAAYGMPEALRHEFAPGRTRVGQSRRRQLSRLCRQITAGAPARFGPFTVSREGLHGNGEPVPWSSRALLFYGCQGNDAPPPGNRCLLTVRCGSADGVPLTPGPEPMSAWSAQAPNLRTLERLCDGCRPALLSSRASGDPRLTGGAYLRLSGAPACPRQLASACV